MCYYLPACLLHLSDSLLISISCITRHCHWKLSVLAFLQSLSYNCRSAEHIGTCGYMLKSNSLTLSVVNMNTWPNEDQRPDDMEQPPCQTVDFISLSTETFATTLKSHLFGYYTSKNLSDWCYIKVQNMEFLTTSHSAVSNTLFI